MFIVFLSAILALMNAYLWKRLVKDTTGPGRTRRILTLVLIALALVLVATLVVPRFADVTAAGWYAWPGYLWFGLVVYLFLTLLVLEPVRLALRGWVKREADSGDGLRRPCVARPAGRAARPAGVEPADVPGAGQCGGRRRRVGRPGRRRRCDCTRTTRPAAATGAPASARPRVSRIPHRRRVGHPPRPAGGTGTHRADRRDHQRGGAGPRRDRG